MDSQKLNATLRKLNAYRRDPELVREPTLDEMATLIFFFIDQVKAVEKAAKAGELDGYTPQAGKDYPSKAQMTEVITSQVNKEIARLNKTNDAQAKQITEALKSIRQPEDGKDGVVSEKEIERAAEMAAVLIDLPDFDAMLAEVIQTDGATLRDALESLPEGEEQLSIEAIRGLRQELSDLADKVGKETLGQFIGGGAAEKRIIQLIAEYSDSLPTQTGNSGKFLTTDGTDASWATLAGGGDMAAAVYDPAGGAAQVAFASELHDAVTVTDSAEIDFTLAGQNITASLIAGSIDETKLDASVNASLDLADSALQNVVEDTTPQLGGNLDLNDNNIISTSGANVAITKTGAGSMTVQAAGGGLVLATTSGNGDVNITPHGTGEAQVDGAKIVTEEGTDTLTNKTIDADNNTITNIGLAEFDTNTKDEFKVFDAIALDSPAVTVTESAGTVSLNLEKSGTGDIRFKFSDGVYTFDSTPIASIALTAGSDISPQINYVYILQSNKTLTVSTSSFPASEHAPIATVLVQSAADVALSGPYKLHAWTDHASGSDGQGHLAHLNRWIRLQPATWESGVAITTTGGASNIELATTSGIVLQLHDQPFPARNTSTGDSMYVVNSDTALYNKVTDLYTETNDANGVALGAWYTFVVWGVVNQNEANCKLMVNMPTGSYLNNTGDKATNDDLGYNVYTIPSDFTGTGFLIAAVTVSRAGSTITIEQERDLRGFFPSTGAGGGAIGGNEFADNVFRIQDDGDTTKQIAFQASALTTANTRTITMADADIDLANTPTAGEKTVLGNTSGTNTGDEAAASATVAGVIELATDAETTTGTATDRAITPANLASQNFLQNLSEDTTPTLGGELDAGANSIGFTMQTATGDGTTTVDWGNGNHMDFTFGAFNETFTFTAPAKPGVYTMSLKQDSVGSRTATWPATVKWPAGTAPTLTTTATTGYDVISFRFDGTNYYSVATLNFS